MKDNQRFRTGSEERRRRLVTRRGHHGTGTGWDTLPLRRASTLAIAVAFLLLALGVTVGAKESFEHNAHLVATQPHLSAPLVGIRGCGRGCTDYVIAPDGQEIVLTNADALHDARIGEDVRYVVDPADPERTVAAGEPGDWIPNPTADLGLFVLFVAIALGVSAWVACKLLPEDVAKLRKRPPAVMSSKRLRGE